MNSIYSGAATLLAGAGTLSTIGTLVFRHRGTDPSIESILEDTRHLSPSGEAALQEVAKEKLLADQLLTPVELSKADRSTIFWNSRIFLCLANRMHREFPEDSEFLAIFDDLQHDHTRMKCLIFLSFVERVIGRLGVCQISEYHRKLLETYGDELDLLGLIAEKCGPEGTAIQAIL
jgi:hypothetical protein